MKQETILREACAAKLDQIASISGKARAEGRSLTLAEVRSGDALFEEVKWLRRFMGATSCDRYEGLPPVAIIGPPPAAEDDPAVWMRRARAAA